VAAFDFVRFGKVAEFLRPAHRGDPAHEQLSALRLLNNLLDAGGLTWADLISLAERSGTAEEAIRLLLVENDELRGRLAEAESRQPDWEPLATPVGKHRQTIDWLLGQYRAGRVWLSPWELEHFPDIARWVGRLTDNHRYRLQKPVERVYQQTDLRPPS